MTSTPNVTPPPSPTPPDWVTEPGPIPPTPMPTPAPVNIEVDPIELEITQYEVGEIEADATSVEVIYTNDEGLIYKRFVNIPRKSDGSVDQEYFDEILYSQLLGVNNKVKVGVAVFEDPNAPEEEEETTP